MNKSEKIKESVFSTTVQLNKFLTDTSRIQIKWPILLFPLVEKRTTTTEKGSVMFI
jgi:hypothetical protein